MGRKARVKSNTGIYHVMVRGINRSDIFINDADRLEYLDILLRMKKEGEYTLYGYCLMSNHVHLLIKEDGISLGQTMKRIGVSYSHYFNKKYERVGHLFQGRFKSEPIEREESLLNCLKYIHNNPVEAKITSMPNEYRWSSYNTYTSNDRDEITETGLILKIFSDNRKSARIKLAEYTQANYSNHHEDFIELEEENTERIDPIEIINYIMLTNDMSLKELVELEDKEMRDKIIVEIKNNTDSTIRELSELTGLSKDMINRAGKES